MIGNSDPFFINFQLSFNDVQPLDSIVVLLHLIRQLIQFVLNQRNGGLVLFIGLFTLAIVVDHADQNSNNAGDNRFDHDSFPLPMMFMFPYTPDPVTGLIK